jgi:putative adhesin
MTATQDATLLLDHPIGPRGRVAIRLPAAEIRIVAEDGDRATVRSLSGRTLPDRVVLETAEDGLTIREQDTLGISFGTGRKSVALEIGVPPEADVTVDTASGSVVTRGLRGEQRYRTASGDLRVEDVSGHIELNAVSGDAFLRLAGQVDLGLRTVSGDVRVEGGSLGSIRAQTTSGDIRLDSPLTGKASNAIETLSGDVSVVASGGMRVEARTVSGDLTSELPHRSEGRAGRRVIVIGDGAVELAFRSVSGDLRILEALGRGPAAPAAPTPPVAPTAPVPPIAPVPPLPGPSRDDSTLSRVEASADDPAASRDATPAQDGPDPDADERLEILRALERGELDVAAAMGRLAELDARSAGDAGDA